MTTPGARSQARYRESHPDYVERGKKMIRARDRSLRMLARKFHLEFEEIYRAELARIGVTPGRPGRPPLDRDPGRAEKEGPPDAAH